jgi:hypothetical protein
MIMDKDGIIMKLETLNEWSELSGRLIEIVEDDYDYILVIKYETTYQINILKQLLHKGEDLKQYLDEEISLLKTDKEYRIKLKHQ